MSQGATSSQIQIQQDVQTQQQRLTAQQIMTVQMIQMNTQQMEEHVRAELQDNPALEENEEAPATNLEDEEYNDDPGDEEQEQELDGTLSGEGEMSSDDYGDGDDNDDYSGRTTLREEIPIDAGTSFYDELTHQLYELPLSEEEQAVGLFIIGLLDDNGFLTMEPARIADELAFKEDVYVEVSTVERVLAYIQHFDPAGIGARDLRECLLLQLDRHQASKTVHDATRILNECFPEFTSRRWSVIAEITGMDEGDVKQALDMLTTLNPRPGSALGEAVGKGMHALVPDFIIEEHDDVLEVYLNNGNIPELSVSADFLEMLREQRQSKTPQTREAARFLQQKIERAQNFIEAIRQRNSTMLKVMRAIAKVQKPFFLSGDEEVLRPMILSDLSKTTELDISTVSRVCADKYVQSPLGIWPLKFFFSNRQVQLGGEGGDVVSQNKMLKALQTIVDNEDSNAPWSDNQLTERMAEQGYNIARRTVVKYRQKLGIPTAIERKR